MNAIDIVRTLLMWASDVNYNEDMIEHFPDYTRSSYIPAKGVNAHWADRVCVYINEIMGMSGLEVRVNYSEDEGCFHNNIS